MTPTAQGIASRVLARTAAGNITPVSPPMCSRAFQLREHGRAVAKLDDEDFKNVPLVPEGSRLQECAA